MLKPDRPLPGSIRLRRADPTEAAISGVPIWHFLGLDPDAQPNSKLEGVALEDPYQYPPQFLLLPRLALVLTDDVATIRVVWFALQGSC
jgi:hypothetical protein